MTGAFGCSLVALGKSSIIGASAVNSISVYVGFAVFFPFCALGYHISSISFPIGLLVESSIGKVQSRTLARIELIPKDQISANSLNDQVAVKSHIIELFESPYHVEFAWRRIVAQPGVTRAKAFELISAIYNHAFKQYPTNAVLHISYGIYCMQFKLNMSVIAYSALFKLAGGSRPSLDARCFLFISSKRHERSRHKNNNGTMDVATFADFKKLNKTARNCHEAALKKLIAAWRCIQSQKQDLSNLSSIIESLSALEKKGTTSYEELVRAYPNNVNVIRSYGQFLLDVKNDFAEAQRCFDVAEQLEDINLSQKSGGNGKVLETFTESKEMNDNQVLRMSAELAIEEDLADEDVYDHDQDLLDEVK